MCINVSKGKVLILCLVMFLFANTAPVFSQTVAQLNNLYNVTGSTKLTDGTTMMYRLYVPRNYDKTKKYPIVLHMHGIGERGNNNNVQLNYEIGKPWVADSVQSKWAPFALAPQCPANLNWGNMGSGYADLAGVGAIKLLDSLKKVYNLDTTRFYVSGLSWGGIGTWAILHSYPDKFAAALPCAGQNGKNDGPTMAKTAIWAWHGDIDPTVNVAGSRNAIAAVEKAGKQVVRFYANNTYDAQRRLTPNKGISWDSLTKAAYGGANYLYTEIKNGDHGHGCDMGWKCPLMVGWLFSKAKVNGKVVKWPLDPTEIARNAKIAQMEKDKVTMSFNSGMLRLTGAINYPATIKIFSTNGKLVVRKNIESEGFINCANVATGTYFVSIHSKNVILASQKMIFAGQIMHK